MVALSGGGALVFGGKKSNVTFLQDLQILDAASLTWSAGPTLPPARTVAMSVPTKEGGAVILGGLNCGGTCSVAGEVDLWHPDGTTSAGPALKKARGLGTATVLLDGTVLVAGGFSNVSSLASVEVLAP